MIGLTGDAENKGVKGSGEEGTVKDAHVVVSTQTMNRAVSDVWAVRSDWYATHKDFCDKFLAGYLKAVEETVALRKQFSETNKMPPAYRNLLVFAQKTFGEKAIPTIEVDGHGLMLDALFVGLPGQISFFEDAGNLTGYERQAKRVLDMATEWGYASTRSGFAPPKLDYAHVAELAGIKYEAPQKVNRIAAEGVNAFPDSGDEEPPIYSFSINFEPNQEEFTSDQYGAEFNLAIQAAATNRNAAIQVRGHSDPTKTLTDLIKAGMSKNTIERRGASGSFRYFVNGDELNLGHTDKVLALIKAGAFDGVSPSPRETMGVALQLSANRAKAVTQAIADFAAKQQVNLDISQVKPIGVGISEPLVAKPKNIEEAKKNMRVEFRIIKVSAEAIKAQDFEY
jgi:outer membrane protein OmpA-like peptidoglycan-associated protein